MGEEAQKASGGNSKLKDSCNEEELTPCIVNIEEAPLFLIDNKFLIRGYRKNFSSMKDIMRSLFMAHNETWNIWTHFTASLMLLLTLAYLFTVYLPHDSVIAHLRELPAKKPHLEDRLAELRASIPSCFASEDSGALGNYDGRNTDDHLCSYLGSIASRQFDSSFTELHSSVLKTQENSKSGTESRSLTESILHAVDLGLISCI